MNSIGIIKKQRNQSLILLWLRIKDYLMIRVDHYITGHNLSVHNIGKWFVLKLLNNFVLMTELLITIWI